MEQQEPKLDQRWRKIIASAESPIADMDSDFRQRLGDRSAREFLNSAALVESQASRTVEGALSLILTLAAAVLVLVSLALVATRRDGEQMVAAGSHDAPEVTQSTGSERNEVELPARRWRLRRAWRESEDALSELLDGHRLAQSPTSVAVRTVWTARNVLILEREKEMKQ